MTADPPRVLVAPVTVTPTKPLTLSHLKGLLWVDALYKSTALVADVDYRYSLTTYNVTVQTLGFWAHLDHECEPTDYSRHTDEEIGELYVRYRARPRRMPYELLRPYREAVEETGWVHPASLRVLQLWAGQYAALGLHDPGLAAVQPPGLGLAEALEMLAGRDLCLDLRADGGPVYLDVTRFGIALRQIVAPDGQPNYLACALRELLALTGSYDEVVLVHDRDLTDDYLMLARVLGEFGVTVSREVVDRVPINGVVQSSRYGGWRGHTVSALLPALHAADPAEAVQLGLRLYFIAGLGRGTRQSFRMDLLRQCVARAGRLLGAAPGATLAEVEHFLRRSMGERCYVDPYRLTSSLLARHGRHGRPPVRELARLVLA